MKEQDLIGRRVERMLTRVLPNTIILRKQKGEVRREVQRSNGKKVWVRFDGNSIDTSVEVLKLKIID